ncbi:MAG: hypothetical protein JW955_00535, partial [Sedimentisphaerales bacterium]|nr:hypothetical protein [Sedimentisphaerales bacterium]
MKSKAILVFLVVVLWAVEPSAWRREAVASDALQPGGSGKRSLPMVVATADPVDVSLLPLPAGQGRTLPWASILLAALLAGGWSFCLLRAMQAGRLWRANGPNGPWLSFTAPRLLRRIVVILILTAAPVESLYSSDRMFTYSVSTGGNLYTVGDTVHWTTSA